MVDRLKGYGKFGRIAVESMNIDGQVPRRHLTSLVARELNTANLPTDPNSGAHGSAHLRHIPALDGLRGIAILLVLACHFYRRELVEGSWWLSAVLGRVFGAGSFGVELFFVLSGFLITGILVDNRERKGSFKNFYARRCLRIFPLYFASLSFVLFIVPMLVALDAGALRIQENQVWLWTYLITWPTAPWVWDDSRIYLMGHLWSLCVEEHFYLVWPPLVYLLSARRLVLCCVLLMLTGVLTRAVSSAFDEGAPILAQWGTLQKIDGLVLGSLIALAVRNRVWQSLLPTGRGFRRSMLLFGFALIITVLWPRGWSDEVIHVVQETLAVATCGLVLLWAIRLRPPDRGYNLLSGRFLGQLGKYSYGIYMIHGIARPAFALMLDFLPEAVNAYRGLPLLLAYVVLASGVSYALAYVSYHVFEEKFLRLKRFFEYAPSRRSLP